MINDMEIAVMVHHHVQQHHDVHQILAHAKSRPSLSKSRKNTGTTGSSSDSNDNGTHSSSSTTQSNTVTKRMSSTSGTQISTINEKKVLILFRGLLADVLFPLNFNKSFGAETKPSRLFADCIDDITFTLELATPSIVPSLSNYLNIKNGTTAIFLIIICMPRIFRSFCGMSAGVTTFTTCKHFALKDNDTDIQSDIQRKKT